MIANYLITALRAFKQQKQHFLLNVMGLSVGLAAAILVAMFTVYEMSYDQQQPNAERVYRVYQDFPTLGMGAPIASATALATMADIAAIEDQFHLEMLPPGAEYKINGVGYKLEGVMGASANLTDFMQLDVLAGDLARVLTQPNTMALSQRTAQWLFGNKNALGETLLQGDTRWTVAAVFADLPENTHFAFNALVKESTRNKAYQNNSGYVYLRLAPQSDVVGITEALNSRYGNLVYPDAPNMVSISLQALTDIHLTSDSQYELKTNGSQSTVQICIGLSLLLVVLASFNFINMSIAQAAKRAKEVGVRKALGASRSQIISQFLIESVLITALAALIACMLVELCLPQFNQLVDRNLALDYVSPFMVAVTGIALAVGVLAGAYPALFISAFSAKRVLSGDLQRGRSAIVVRKSLLVLQSALSVSLIIGALLLQQQLQFLQHLPVGYSKEAKLQVSDLDAGDVFYKQNNALLQRVAAITGVKQVGIIDISLTDTFNSSMQVSADNGQFQDQVLPFIGVGMDAVSRTGLTLIAGRDFSQQTAADWYAVDSNNQATASVLLTESLVKQAGYSSPEQALGKVWTASDGRNPFQLKIVGVVKDVKVGSMRQAQPSTLFICGYTSSWTGRLLIDIDMAQFANVKNQLTQVLGDMLDIYDPKIEFVAQNYQAIYQSDARTAQLVSIFSGLAVFLACVGTFGLASFSTLRRQKEVGIRKVLGASRFSIVNLLAKEFLLLVAVSIAIAYPLTYWLVGDWLANFNDRIEQAFWVYALAAVAVAVITWLTVASLALKAASTRPSLILRYE